MSRQVGYGSEYSFSRAFTRFHGQPPGRYRRQSRQPLPSDPGIGEIAMSRTLP